MGLDMYLFRKYYVGGVYNSDWHPVDGTIDITVDGKHLPIDVYKVEDITERVGYWRKANQIHHWFVMNVQDGKDECFPFYVDIDKLKELLELCKEVDSKIKLVEKGDEKVIENAEEVASLLPTSEGFFFGSMEYDSWYARDIQNTIEILETVIKEDEELRKQGIVVDYEYQASW